MATTSGFSASPVGPTSGGKVYAFNNLTTSPEVVAPANQFRTSITFDNPGSVDIIVFPVQVQALNPSWTASSSLGTNTSIANVALTPTTVALGGGYRIYANGGTRTFTGECQGAWQALAVTSTGNALTVTDTNV
jgi:hypothetical protein